MPTKEARALFHPIRARILELVKEGPALQSDLAEATGTPYAEVAYHCRALHRSGCIQPAPSSSPKSGDPLYEVV